MLKLHIETGITVTSLFLCLTLGKSLAHVDWVEENHLAL